MRKTQKTAVVGGTVVALLGAGIAFAAWTSTGQGSGSAAAGTAADLTVTGSNEIGLYPSQSKDITFTVTNANPYQVTLTDLTVDSVTVDAGHAACTIGGNAEVTAADATGLSAIIAATGGTATQTISVSMGAGSDDACQGATFTVLATATAHSS